MTGALYILVAMGCFTFGAILTSWAFYYYKRWQTMRLITYALTKAHSVYEHDAQTWYNQYSIAQYGGKLYQRNREGSGVFNENDWTLLR